MKTSGAVTCYISFSSTSRIPETTSTVLTEKDQQDFKNSPMQSKELQKIKFHLTAKKSCNRKSFVISNDVSPSGGQILSKLRETMNKTLINRTKFNAQ